MCGTFISVVITATERKKNIPTILLEQKGWFKIQNRDYANIHCIHAHHT